MDRQKLAKALEALRADLAGHFDEAGLRAHLDAADPKTDYFIRRQYPATVETVCRVCADLCDHSEFLAPMTKQERELRDVERELGGTRLMGRMA